MANESGISKRGSALDAHFDEIVNIRFPINVAHEYAQTHTRHCSFRAHQDSH